VDVRNDGRVTNDATPVSPALRRANVYLRPAGTVTGTKVRYPPGNLAAGATSGAGRHDARRPIPRPAAEPGAARPASADWFRSRP